ncbi:MAG: hypothetical protein JNM43_24635 [Planctomycetaceae bacterium]|nr:hypothetical protein [Planctomycetaceae bacterium]
MAVSLFHRMAELAPDLVPLIVCPVITQRVAELARAYGISWCDSAGNCRIQQTDPPLLIVRKGFKPVAQDLSSGTDPFSVKSSRIVRALLSHPQRVWSVQELVDQPDVQVSLGLVSKVRKTLTRDAYIADSNRGTQVLDPAALLQAWSSAYRGPSSRHQFFALGEPAEIELRFLDWCRQNNITTALSGFSAAWKLAPMVKTPVVTAYVDPMPAFTLRTDQLAAETGIARVESGANLILWEPYDTSVFTDRRFSDDTRVSWTSPIQTWLDLIQLKGRGQEAADEVYQRLIRPTFEQPRSRADSKDDV